MSRATAWRSPYSLMSIRTIARSSSNLSLIHIWPLAGRFRVLDPVMVATSGSRLLADDAVDAVRALLPYADVITPNLPEAGVLTGRDAATTVAGMREQALVLRAELGARRVLIKGGHLQDLSLIHI